MEKILKYLEKLDLSEIEAKLYVTLLQTGPTSVRDIATAIGIKRTTAYLYVDQLEEKGLITKMMHSSRPQIAANSPESSLEYLVKDQVQRTKTIESDFPHVLEIIKTSIPQFSNTEDAEIKYYKGKAGVKKIYEEALQAQELRSYANLSEISEVFPENFQMFNTAFQENKNIRVFEIFEDSPQSRKQIELSGQNDRYSYKFLPESMKFAAQDILIYDGNVAIVNLKDQINGVILRNTDLYNNFKLLFDFNWNILLNITS